MDEPEFKDQTILLQKKTLFLQQIELGVKFLIPIIAIAPIWWSYHTWKNDQRVAIERELKEDLFKYSQLAHAALQKVDAKTPDAYAALVELEDIHHRLKGDGGAEVQEIIINGIGRQLRTAQGSGPVGAKELLTTYVKLHSQKPVFLDGFELSGLDMRQVLRGHKIASAKGANMAGANLMQVDLSNTDFTDCDLTGAKLDGAILVSAKISGCAREASFVGAKLDHADFSNSQVQEADFTDAFGKKTVFNAANASKAIFLFRRLDQPQVWSLTLAGAKTRPRSIFNATGASINVSRQISAERQSQILDSFVGWKPELMPVIDISVESDRACNE